MRAAAAHFPTSGPLAGTLVLRGDAPTALGAPSRRGIDLSVSDTAPRQAVVRETPAARATRLVNATLELPSLRGLAAPRRSRPETVRAMGITEQTALHQSGDSAGSAFSRRHIHGDLANRWSHAAVVALVSETLREAGANGTASSLIGAAVFLPKELLLDRRPSASDLVLDARVFHRVDARGETTLNVTVFGDGAAFAGLRRTF